MCGRFAIVLVLAGAGCAPLAKAPAATPIRLPQARLAPDAVVIDIAFVRLPAAEEAASKQIWDAADEQVLSAEVRRELAANGLRVGVFGQELPARLRELLDAPHNPLESLNTIEAADVEVDGTRQHVPLRAGHRAKIKTAKVLPELALLLTEQAQLRGHQLTDAQCLLAVRPFPQGDGRVKLSITPEIEHGAVKSRWTGGEGMMIQQTGQDRLVLDRLRLDVPLAAGQSVILSATDEIKGVGKCFFTETAGSALQRRMLILRLAQSQFDDLFAPEQTTAPLSTPGGH